MTWTPCTDFFPVMGRMVLVRLMTHRDPPYYTTMAQLCGRENGTAYWWHMAADFPLDAVVCWMAIPEPPEGM